MFVHNQFLSPRKHGKIGSRFKILKLPFNNAGHLSSFHIIINYGGNQDTMGMANNERELQCNTGTKVSGRVPSVSKIADPKPASMAKSGQ